MTVTMRRVRQVMTIIVYLVLLDRTYIESTRVMRPAAQDDGDTPDTDSKKRSSKRDLWKKKRNSNKRYLTQLVDSLVS